MKLYLIIVFFIFRKCARRVNVLSLTLESHDSNFSDVVDALSFMTKLDAELITFIDDKELFLCVFILVYIENMSQQQKNFDFMSHEAHYDCCFCFIHLNDRANLEFNVIKEDRFHHEVMRMRKNMKQMKISQKNRYCTFTDLNQQMSLAFISSTLDIILTQSSDSAHSKYENIIKLLHSLLINTIFISVIMIKYEEQLRSFFFSSEWFRIQSLIHHLESYSFQKHACWSIIISNLLRCWLKKFHIQKKYIQAIEQVFESSIKDEVTSLDLIITFFVIIAKINTLLMINSLSVEDWVDFQDAIKHFRWLFQQLHEAASQAISSSWNVFRDFSLFSQRSSVIASTQSSESLKSAIRAALSKKKFLTNDFENINKRLNVHINCHHELIIKEYNMCSNCNVLIEEDKHR